MKIRQLLLALFAVGIVIVGRQTAHATDHSGTCTGTFAAADNPHRLVSHCTVPAGQSLTIASTVTLNGQGFSIFVDGTLNIDGATLTSTQLEYRTGSGGTVQNSTLTGGIVYVHGSSTLTPITPQILNNTLSNPSSYAIQTYGTSKPTISGNTITAFYGVYAYQTSQPTISTNSITTPAGQSGAVGLYVLDQALVTATGNTISTDGYGIRFQETTGGSVTGNTVGFRAEGNNNRNGIRLEGLASPTINGNTIQDDAARADYDLVILVNVGSTATITNNSVCATGSDRPFYLDAGAFLPSVTVTGNTFPCGLGGGAELQGDTVAADAQLKALSGVNTYKMIGTWTVSNGVTLSVASGVTLNGQGHTIQSDGVLNVSGATLNQTHLEYRTGSSGTVQNNTITNAIVYIHGSSTLNPITPQILSNTFSHPTSYAIQVYGTGKPTISGNTITASYGVYAYQNSQPTVSNNTITTQAGSSSAVGIYALDQAQVTASTNTITTDGNGIWFQETAGGSVTGNTIGFRAEGNSNRDGIRLEGSASPTVDGNTILDDATRADYGLLILVAVPSTAAVTNNSVCSTGSDRPLYLGPTAFSTPITISGNTFPCGNGGGAELAGGTVSENAQLKAFGSINTYKLVSTWTVTSGKTLAIASGVTVNGQGNTIQSDGVLNVNGATLNQTHLEYRTGSSGTVQNSTFTNATIYIHGSSTVTPITPQILNNTFTQTCCSTAVQVYGTGKPTISGNTITAYYGVQAYQTSQPTITNNTITALPGRSDAAGIYTYDQAIVTASTNTITTDGYGIRFQEDARGTVTGNTIGFRSEGNNSRSGIRLEGVSSPTVDGNTIQDDATRADYDLLVLVDTPSTAAITNNSICATGSDRPLYLGPTAFSSPITISGNTFPCGSGGGAELAGGTQNENAQLKTFNGITSYKLVSYWTIPAGKTLTINSGVTVNSPSGYGFLADGALNINGATLDRAYIEYRTGSSGTVQNSTIMNTTVYIHGTSTVTPITPQIVNNTFDNATCCTTALQVYGTGKPTISGNTITAYYGVQAYQTSRPTVTNNIITALPGRSDGAGIYAHDQAVVTASANTISTDGYGMRFVETTGGTLSGNTIGFRSEGNSNRSGIRLEGVSSPTVDGNTIQDDATRADYDLLVLVDTPSTATITNNSICATGSDRPLYLGPTAFSSPITISGNTFPCGSGGGAELAGGTQNENAQLKTFNGITAYKLVGYWTIPAGKTLTITNGVTVNSPSGYGFLADGSLNINGATLDRAYLEYRTGSSGTVQNSTITNAIVYIHGSSTVNPITPQILNNTITSSSGNYGIQVYGTGKPTISGNTINAFYGVYTYQNSQPTISNNVITTQAGSSGAVGVYALDQAQPTVTTNTITTDGYGVRFQETTRGSVSSNTIGFRAEGNNNRSGIRLEGSASPAVTGNTVQDDTTRSDSGLVMIVDAPSSATLTNNTVNCSGGDTPLQLGLGLFADALTPQISGNTFTCGIATAGLNISGALTGNATLKPVDGLSSFRLTSSLTVNAGARLRIDPGVTLNGQNNSLTANGTLNVNGAALNNVFVSFPQGGNGGITNSSLTGPAFSTAISVTNASPSFTGNMFSNMSTVIGLSGTTNAIIDNNQFNSTVTAVFIGGGVARARVSNNTFSQNTNALSFNDTDALFGAFPTQFNTNTFVGTPDKNTLRLPGTLSASGTLLVAPVPYQSTGMTISSGATITVQPGTVIQNTASTVMIVNGELVATGSSSTPIVFTSVTPKAGTRWRGLQINNKSSASPTVLDGTVIEFAGVFDEGAVRLSNADIQVKNSLITDSSGPGVELLSGSDATLTKNSIVQNAGHGITMTSSAPTINLNSIFNNGSNGAHRTSCTTANDLTNVRNNYWGDDSGPRDNSDDRAGGGLFNPSGLGEEVSNCVGFDPWIRIGPSIEGTISIISGGDQIGMVGTVLPQPLVVELRSTLGTLLENIDVIFSVIEGDASIVESQPMKTGANGRASAQLRLGLIPGPVTVAVTARDVNSPLATFTGTGTPGSGLLGFGLQALPVAVEVRPGKKGGPGDVNNDGKVNNTDAVILLAVLDGALPPNVEPAFNFSQSGDFNRDGQIDEADALTIQGYAVHMITQARR